MLPSTISTSYSRMLRVSRSWTNGTLFKWTPWIWSGLNPFFYWWINWIFSKFLLPVLDFRANGDQEHEKDTGCRYMVVSCSLHTSESWLYHFSIELRVRLRSCTPQVRLWLKQQIHLSLWTCRTSTLCSFFLGYKTLWRQFCWESLSTLPSRHGCTQIWIDPAGCCFSCA